MYSSEYNLPVFIGTGAVLTSGQTADLKSGQVGIFSAKTYQAVTGAVAQNQALLVAGGSWHSKSKLNKFVGNLTTSDKTVDFLGKDILSFERSRPKKAKSEQWILGWDGISTTDTLSFEANKDYHFRVKVWGEDVYGTFLRPVDRFIRVRTKCGEDGQALGGKTYAKQLAAAINADPELQYFIKAETVSSNYAAPTQTHTLYSISVVDAGDQAALAAVQTAYPGLDIKRISRVGLTSTYEVCRLTTAGAPAAFQPTSSISLAACDGTCPSGYTAVAASDVYIITRPLGGSDVTDAAGQAAYVTALRADYTGDTAGTFLSANGSVAQVEVKFPVGTVVTAVKSDIVTKVATIPAQCTPPAASTIAWSTGATRYKVTRTLTLTLEKECGTANRLTDLQAFYAADSSIVSGSVAVQTAGTCNDTYTIQQYSSDCSVDNCLSEAEISFAPLQAFEGFTWTEVPVADNDTTVKTGVRITTAYEDSRFGGCSFNPADYYSVRPLKLEVTQFDDSGAPCATPVPSRKIRNSQMATQSGEWVIRKFIEANKYKAFGEFHLDPRVREVLDGNIHEVVDRKKFYKLYFLKVRQNRKGQNHEASFSPEIFEFMFAFPEDVDTTNFEVNFEKVTAQFGIFLQDR